MEGLYLPQVMLCLRFSVFDEKKDKQFKTMENMKNVAMYGTSHIFTCGRTGTEYEEDKEADY